MEDKPYFSWAQDRFRDLKSYNMASLFPGKQSKQTYLFFIFIMAEPLDVHHFDHDLLKKVFSE